MLPVEQPALIAVLDIERLDDGRVGAYVIVDTFTDPQTSRCYGLVAKATFGTFRAYRRYGT
jgi:hypothetical protein